VSIYVIAHLWQLINNQILLYKHKPLNCYCSIGPHGHRKPEKLFWTISND